jgi:hypothetical protein
MLIRDSINIAAAVQGRVHGHGSVVADTTMAMQSALICSSELAQNCDCILELLLEDN